MPEVLVSDRWCRGRLVLTTMDTMFVRATVEGPPCGVGLDGRTIRQALCVDLTRENAAVLRDFLERILKKP